MIGFLADLTIVVFGAIILFGVIGLAVYQAITGESFYTPDKISSDVVELKEIVASMKPTIEKIAAERSESEDKPDEA